MVATIDPSLTRQPPTQKVVSGMSVGETSYLPSDYIMADNTFSLYVVANAPVSDTNIGGYCKIDNENDGYHLTIPNTEGLIAQDTVNNFSANASYLPISILVVDG